MPSGRVSNANFRLFFVCSRWVRAGAGWNLLQRPFLQSLHPAPCLHCSVHSIATLLDFASSFSKVDLSNSIAPMNNCCMFNFSMFIIALDVYGWNLLSRDMRNITASMPVSIVWPMLASSLTRFRHSVTCSAIGRHCLYNTSALIARKREFTVALP